MDSYTCNNCESSVFDIIEDLTDNFFMVCKHCGLYKLEETLNYSADEIALIIKTYKVSRTESKFVCELCGKEGKGIGAEASSWSKGKLCSICDS